MHWSNENPQIILWSGKIGELVKKYIFLWICLCNGVKLRMSSSVKKVQIYVNENLNSEFDFAN